MEETPDRPATIRHYRRLIKTIVRSYFGKPATRIVYRSSGRTNYVFAVNHLEGQFVIRISPDTERISAFQKELWTTQKAREAGVPSSEVIAVGNDVIAEPYMITRRVTGTEASRYPKRDRIVHELGRYAAIINSIHTQGFGTNFDWNPHESAHLTWSDYLEREFQLENRLRVLASNEILSSTEMKKLEEIIEETKAAHIKPSLNHGDLRLKNVIVDEDGQIAAIVDWEECLSTIAPQWELSIALHDLTIDEKHLFIEGYGLSSSQVEEIAPLIKAFNLINYSSAIQLAVDTGDHKSLAEFRLRFKGCLDMYSL